MAPTIRGRRRARVQLEVAALDGAEHDSTRDPVMHWLVAGPMGAMLVAVAGWVLLTAPVVVAWVATEGYSLREALGVGTQLWLLANGGGAELDGTRLTLIPLGLTLLFAIALSGVAGFTARQARSLYEGNRERLTRHGARRLTIQTTLLIGITYAFVVTLASFFVAAPVQTARSLLGSVVLGVLAAAVGAARALDYDATAAWPRWARAVPRAAAAAVLVMTVAAAGVLASALITHTGRIGLLESKLGLGGLGGTLLFLLDLAYLPTMLIWSGAYALGAGFSLGHSSVVSPALTNLGMLPGIPVLGALPRQGAGDPWLLAWLASGIVAGLVAAWVVVRARRRARFDETTLVGGLAGVVAGIACTAVGALATGDLGNTNLAGMGPRITPLFVMGASIMGLSGMVSGLVLGLRRVGLDPQDPDDEITLAFAPDEPTTAVRRILPDDEATQVLEADDAVAEEDLPTEVVEPASHPDEERGSRE